MLEFGSDFHVLDGYMSQRAHLDDIYPDAHFVANGRMCIFTLIKQYGWKRIWMPEYFCYEVIDSLKRTGIEVMLYKDYPGNDDETVIRQLPFLDGDVLLRMNYFGMRDLRKEDSIPVPVIEDHTHDLLGHWALYSNADWCIASLRKTYPVPEGGMLWSPKGHKLTVDIASKLENEQMAAERWSAMEMKRDYLAGKDVSKPLFREKFLRTEDVIDKMQDIADIDVKSREYVENIDHNSWFKAKKRNHSLLRCLVNAESIEAEDDSNNLFSFVMLLLDKARRDQLRSRLADAGVYTAVLWNVPETASFEVKDFSERMLSVHCDGRYSEEDIHELAGRIYKVL